MTLRLSVLAALTIFSAGCGPSACERIQAAEDACLAEYAATGDTDGTFTSGGECEGSMGADVTKCMIDAYENGDCSTGDGAFAAANEAGSCMFTSGIVGALF